MSRYGEIMRMRWTPQARIRFYFGASAFLFFVSGVALLSHGGIATALPLVFAVGMLIRAFAERRNVNREASSPPSRK